MIYSKPPRFSEHLKAAVIAGLSLRRKTTTRQLLARQVILNTIAANTPTLATHISTTAML